MSTELRAGTRRKSRGSYRRRVGLLLLAGLLVASCSGQSPQPELSPSTQPDSVPRRAASVSPAETTPTCPRSGLPTRSLRTWM